MPFPRTNKNFLVGLLDFQLILVSPWEGHCRTEKRSDLRDIASDLRLAVRLAEDCTSGSPAQKPNLRLTFLHIIEGKLYDKEGPEVLPHIQSFIQTYNEGHCRTEKRSDLRDIASDLRLAVRLAEDCTSG
jgi:hypothetical protein